MKWPKPRSHYVAENRNPLARPDEAGAGSGPGTSGPNQRPRVTMSGPILKWIIGILGVLALFLLLLMIWSTFFARPQQANTPNQGPLLGSPPTVATGPMSLGGNPEAGQPPVATSAPVVSGPTGGPPIPPDFAAFYSANGGIDILGNPMSEVIVVNGREIQWFERARMERWPEYAGSPYEIQLGRLGAEYTAGREFADQQFFVSRPDLRFFAETSHSIGGAFLTFWEANGGVKVFGLPISEEFDELLPNGKTYRVQYFERARLELHPDAAGTPYIVQVGLLGSALYQNESRPTTIQPVPTRVPLP
ncbi:hypothetical protein OSCT_0119 [Oscillochloris trichoides DG-6]|uniref:Uncharacterized protein n=1 Tax=Oscillochloris trichoides DG-6 TaxID=765420 RepID=E1I9W8_9CHLR|nr:hypothetical protein [Oscillochloris trichoides]EFO81970.1 hypothetical protein OSCT_0119 [Oscillochloris trichoides DG-6]